MIDSFLITSRETLEASLVVGVVLSYLHKTNNHNYKKNVYYGIISGIIASILAAILFNFLAGGMEGAAENIFEGATMILGSVLLTTMIFWMIKQKHVSRNIEEKVEKRLSDEKRIMSHFGIFMVIFIAIIREGAETVIFLNALNYAGGMNFIGGTLGVIAAVVLGYLFFISTRKLNIKKVFSISSVLLIFFAAGLFSHGVHELEEAGILPGIISPVWDINPVLNIEGSYPILHEKGIVGGFMKGLFGYNADPSLMEILAYLSYFGVIFFLYRRVNKTINDKSYDV